MGPPLSIIISASKQKGAHPARGGETDGVGRAVVWNAQIQKAAFSRDYGPGQQSERAAPPKHMEVRATYSPPEQNCSEGEMHLTRANFYLHS